MSDAPDFAMARAVELLAQLANEHKPAPGPPRAPDQPIVLFNETQSFALGTTKKREVERKLGSGHPFPGGGWHTYAIAGPRRLPLLLSVFYRGDDLVAVEYYIPKTKNAPNLEPRELGAFRFVPGEVHLGMALTSLSADYAPARGGPGAVIYKQSHEARFPRGVAYVMSNGGIIERLVLYADL